METFAEDVRHKEFLKLPVACYIKILADFVKNNKLKSS